MFCKSVSTTTTKRRAVAVKAKPKKRVVAVKEKKKDVSLKIDKQSRINFAKQLHEQQEALKSISTVLLNMGQFLDSNLEEEKEDKIFVRCPSCHYQMNESQVMEGFANNVLDHKTTCTQCNHKFTTIARIHHQYYVWLCPEQTKDQFELWKSQKVFKENEDIVSMLTTDRPEIVFNAYKYSAKDNFKTVKDAVENWLQV